MKTLKITLKESETLTIDGPATIKCEPASQNSRRMTYTIDAPPTTRVARQSLTLKK